MRSDRRHDPSLDDAVRGVAKRSRIAPRPRRRVGPCPCSASPGRSASSARSPTATRSASTPTTPPQWARVPGPNAVRTNAGGGAQLRLDGIDALETHYSPRGGGPLHQPIDLAHQARDELVRWLGFRGIERTGETVTAATPEELPGYLLTRGADVYGRCVALVGRGDAAGAQRDAGDGQGRRPAPHGQPPADRHGPRLPDLLPQALRRPARRAGQAVAPGARRQEGRVGRRPHPEGRRRREPRHADRRRRAAAQALPAPRRLPRDQRPRRLARRVPGLSRAAPGPRLHPLDRHLHRLRLRGQRPRARSCGSRPSPRTSSSRRRERLSRRCAPGRRRTRACAGGPGRGCRSRTPWRSPCRDRSARSR